MAGAGCRTGIDDEALRELARYGAPCAIKSGKARLEVRMGTMWKGGTEGRLVTVRRMLVYRLRHGGVEVVPESWTGRAATVVAEYSENAGSPIKSGAKATGFRGTIAVMSLSAVEEGRAVWRGRVEAEAPAPAGIGKGAGPGALEEDLLWRSRSLLISRFSAAGVFETARSAGRTPVRPALPGASSGRSR
jgi:hypothetical protein